MPTVTEALARRLKRFVARSKAPDGRLRAAESLGAIQKGSHAGPLIAYETLGQPVWAPRDYATFAREGFMQNAIVYRCVRMIGEAAATIPLLLYEGDTEIESHPLLDLIRRPSLDHTGTDFFESWYGFLLVAGNAYVEAVGLDGQLRELHILRPDRMKVIPGPDGWPEGYEYTAGGQSIRFYEEAVAGVRPILHVRLFHPANDHYGMSPIEAAATAIDIHNTASGWNKALLDNSARPSGALVYAAANGQMTGEQFERLKSELETSFQGARHAGRPLLLEGGLDWKPLSLTPKDMDFIEAKNSAAREIALALGVPPMLLGIPGDNTYSNYQEAQRAFWRQTVLPLVNRTAKAMSTWLAPAFGGDLQLCADLDQIEALAGEREALWARLQSVSFLTDDEKRAAAGYGAPLNPPSDSPAGSRPEGAAKEAANGGAGPFVRADAKYREDQPRVPAGSGRESGRWTDEGGDSALGDGRVRVAQAGGGGSGYPINILEEDALGGHTFERHVNKSEEYLKARILESRSSVKFLGLELGAGEKRGGSFASLEAATKLVNSVLAEPQNQVKLKGFVDGGIGYLLPVLDLYPLVPFGSPTGYEAFAPNDRAKPVMRSTHSVLVRVRRTNKSAKGYYVSTAYPLNED